MLRLRAIFAIQPLEIRNVSNHVKNFPFVFGQPFLGYFVFAMITMVEFRRLELWWWGQYTQDHFHIWQQYHPWFLLIPSKPNDQLCCPGATALHEDHRHEFSEFSHFSMCTFTHLAKLVQITVSFSQCLKIFSKGRILRLKLIWQRNYVHVWNTGCLFENSVEMLRISLLYQGIDERRSKKKMFLVKMKTFTLRSSKDLKIH